MKITPSLPSKYRPRVSATCVLLSPRIGGVRTLEIQVQARRLRAAPLVGQKLISKSDLANTVGLSDGGFEEGRLALSATTGLLVLQTGTGYITLTQTTQNLLFTIKPVYSDNVGLSDTVTFSISKSLSSGVTGSDVLISEGAGTLSLSETAVASDSGVAFIQSYVDNTDYFAADYVGTASLF